MKTNKTIQLAAFLLGALPLMTSLPAYSGTVAGSLTVSATVADTCSVNSPTLAFGTYNPAGVNTDSTATISVTCTNGTAYSVGLNEGGGSGATVTTRKMTSSGHTLNYALYSDSGHTTNWGNTSGTWVTGTANGSAQALTVYGRIPTSQYVNTGSYSDTVAITVTYP